MHTKIPFTLRPKHRIDFTCRIPTFKYFDKTEIVTTWKQVDGYNWVGIYALVGHVTIVLNNIAGAYIKFHPVIQETCRIAECKVKTIVTVIGDYTLRIYGCSRKESLIFLRSGRKSNRVSEYQSGVEEILRLESGT